MLVNKELIPLVFENTSNINTIVQSGGEIYSRCKEYEKNYNYVTKCIDEYIKMRFGEYLPVVYPWAGQNVFGIQFKDAVPKGWNKPNKQGVSWPGQVLRKEIAAEFPIMPTTYPIFKDFIPTILRYVSLDGVTRGSTSLISRLEPQISWFEMNGEITYFLVVPNVFFHTKRLKESGYEITEPSIAINWKWPEDLVAITKERYEFMWAEFKLYKADRELKDLISEGKPL